MKGEVAFYHDTKKYGFIEPEDGTEDVFFHVDDMEGEEIAEGDEVEFETEEADRGPKAVDVRRLD